MARGWWEVAPWRGRVGRLICHGARSEMFACSQSFARSSLSTVAWSQDAPGGRSRAPLETRPHPRPRKPRETNTTRSRATSPGTRQKNGQHTSLKRRCSALLAQLHLLVRPLDGDNSLSLRPLAYGRASGGAPKRVCRFALGRSGLPPSARSGPLRRPCTRAQLSAQPKRGPPREQLGQGSTSRHHHLSYIRDLPGPLCQRQNLQAINCH